MDILEVQIAARSLQKSTQDIFSMIEALLKIINERDQEIAQLKEAAHDSTNGESDD